jgi:hypothetical protein
MTLYRLVVDDRSEFLLRLLIVAGEKIVELCDTNCREDLSTPYRIVGLPKLLTDQYSVDGGDHGG